MNLHEEMDQDSHILWPHPFQKSLQQVVKRVERTSFSGSNHLFKNDVVDTSFQFMDWGQPFCLTKEGNK